MEIMSNVFNEISMQYEIIYVDNKDLRELENVNRKN